MSCTTAAFYFDLASPLAYLAAERVLHVLGGRARVAAEWQPVLARELPGGGGLEARRCAEEGVFRSELACRARELKLQPLRWPDPFPFDSSLAMRVATYAKSIGRAVPFDVLHAVDDVVDTLHRKDAIVVLLQRGQVGNFFL